MHDLTDRSSPIIFILYAVVVRSECHGNLGFWLHKFVLDFLQSAQGQKYTHNPTRIWLNVA